jgi:serine/threonine-protein kinase
MGPGEHWYILMDHLEGAQLHHWHDFDVPLPAADSAGFIHQACLGLAEVHTAGVVHRDLNPQRLWVEPDRTLKIMDFSSARSWNSMATGDNVTVNTVVTGSPEYAAPEQMFASELTPAADVYSLGVVLYEMLSGHSPFFPAKSCSAARADLAENPALWLRAHAQTAPTPLSEHPACAGVPAKLAELVLQTLAKEPGDRPENAGALANGLGWILHHDLGAAQAGILRTLREGQRARYHLVLPGSHRIGYGPGLEVSLDPEAESRPQAVIEWAGPPKSAELLPSDGATILLNGHPVSGRKPLGGGDHLRIGDYELAFTYPPGYG